MASQAKPLGFMIKVSDWVSIYRPVPAKPNPGAPSIVVVLAWMAASERALAKYVRLHQTLFPSAEIMLVQSGQRHAIFRPAAITTHPDAEPAVAILRSVAGAAAPSSTPRLLIHCFSLGGVAMLGFIRGTYGAAFPPHVTVYDSAPGHFHIGSAMRAPTVNLGPITRPLAMPFVASVLVIYVLWFLGRRDPQRRAADYANENAAGELRRAYVYSDRDDIVDWRDVEAHAAEAVKKGYQVQTEKFVGTGHVSHYLKDEGRYVGVVRETWAGPSPKL